LKGGYTRDSYSVYYGGKKLKWVDIDSFQQLSHLYAMDKNAVYYDWEKMKKVDPNTSEVFWHWCFIKDDKFVYKMGKVIEWADPKTFSYTPESPLLESFLERWDVIMMK
jgi:hypothetical protein